MSEGGSGDIYVAFGSNASEARQPVREFTSSVREAVQQQDAAARSTKNLSQQYTEQKAKLAELTRARAEDRTAGLANDVVQRQLGMNTERTAAQAHRAAVGHAAHAGGLGSLARAGRTVAPILNDMNLNMGPMPMHLSRIAMQATGAGGAMVAGFGIGAVALLAVTQGLSYMAEKAEEARAKTQALKEGMDRLRESTEAANAAQDKKDSDKADKIEPLVRKIGAVAGDDGLALVKELRDAGVKNPEEIVAAAAGPDMRKRVGQAIRLSRVAGISTMDAVGKITPDRLSRESSEDQVAREVMAELMGGGGMVSEGGWSMMQDDAGLAANTVDRGDARGRTAVRDRAEPSIAKFKPVNEFLAPYRKAHDEARDAADNQGFLGYGGKSFSLQSQRKRDNAAKAAADALHDAADMVLEMGNLQPDAGGGTR